jgi:hypothetical protein
MWAEGTTLGRCEPIEWVWNLIFQGLDRQGERTIGRARWRVSMGTFGCQENPDQGYRAILLATREERRGELVPSKRHLRGKLLRRQPGPDAQALLRCSVWEDSHWRRATARSEIYPPDYHGLYIKWPEVYDILNKEASTISGVLAASVFCHLGVPKELYRDQGQNFKPWQLQEFL